MDDGVILSDVKDPPIASRLDFRVLFESAPGLYLVLDPDFRIVAASDNYLSATMTKRADIVGRDIFDAFPDNPNDPAAKGTQNLRASLEAVLRTNEPHRMPPLQYDIRKPASEGGGFEARYWSPVNTPVLERGKLTHIIHRVEDVSDVFRLQQRQLQTELRNFAVAEPDGLGLIPRANLYSLLMNAPAAVCIVRDRGQIIEFANPKFQELVNGSEVLGRPAPEVLPRHQLDPLANAVAEVLRTGNGYVNNEVSVPVHRDGVESKAIYTFMAQPMKAGDGVDGVVLFGFDVTEQVEARRRVEELANHLREADRAKDEFIAIISHELRTPMTSILGWSRMLALGGLDDNVRVEAIDAIDRSTRAQAKLIEDLLDESRIAAGRLRLDTRALDVRAIVDGAITMVRPQAEARGLTMQFDGEKGQFPVAGDPIRLQQVVINVLGNAIKFTGEGGSVAVALDREPPFAVIRVRDTGRGITPELLPHVFDRFRQGDSTATDRQGGLGLGLAIARHLVEMHGGTVEAASEGTGKGATITIRLPMHEAAPQEAAFIDRDAARVTRMPALGGVRVLVVEDEADNRRVVAAALQQCGANVECVGTAAAAFDRITHFTPHVLVCDIALPDLDGCAFLEQLRSGAHQTPNAIPALALTVFGRPGEQARIKAAGFQVFRQKPIDPVDLAHEVARLASASSP